MRRSWRAGASSEAGAAGAGVARIARWLAFAFLSGSAAAAATPEDRAIAYLAKEVPAWFAENRCYSCHNNGDGARALYAAIRRGRRVPEAALRDTSAWLASPAQWEQNRGDPRFSDKRLARLQFSMALAEAKAAGTLREAPALEQAARRLIQDQRQNGSWSVEDDAEAGSPATWGSALATALAIRVIEPIDRARAGHARAWLEERPLRFVSEAAAVVIGAGPREAALEFLRRARASDGGWGPAPYAPAEPFDTAIALVAFARAAASRGAAEAIAGGRAWLLRAQLPSGGWPETTRPPGGRSYAQHISTTAWCLIALLETGPAPQAATMRVYP
jgi:hypothetical protein